MKKVLISIATVVVVAIVTIISLNNQIVYENITADQLNQYLKDNPDSILIDVRSSEEYELNHIDEAVNIASENALEEIEEKYQKDDQLIIIDRNGSMSQVVSQELIENEYTNVVNVSNGMLNYE